MKMTVFWDTAPCTLVEVDRNFSGAYGLHHHGDESPCFSDLLQRDYMALYPRKLSNSLHFI
jgi:hypothetical protein